jgi:hypothetical protein
VTFKLSSNIAERSHWKLCYIRYGRAFFCEKEPSEVWGDDWNDAPYEHNAGWPYDPHVAVMYDGDFDTPDTHMLNSSYSVEMINAKNVPWLKSNRYSSAPPFQIWAGATLAEFVDIVLSNGGTVYLPVEKDKDHDLC